MPDSTSNFVVDAVNGPIPSDSVTRAEFITALEQLNYANGNIRSIDNLSGTAGLVSIDGSGAANVRSITGATGLTVANGDGSGNPEVSLNAPHTFRQTYNDTSSNTVSDTKLYNVISSASGSPFTLPQPASGFITVKNIVNTTSGIIEIDSSDWGISGLSDVQVPSGETLTVISDTASKWYPQNALSETNPFGAIRQSTSPALSAAPIPSAGGYVALNAPYLTTSIHPSTLTNFDMPASGRLRYTGEIPIDCAINVSMSGRVSHNAVTVAASIFKHDASAATSTEITGAEQFHHHASQNTEQNMSLIVHVELHQNDYVYAAVRQAPSTSVAANYTAYKFYMAASGHKIITA